MINYKVSNNYMNEYIYLNRMDITGAVNAHTPIPVLIEILDAHSIADYDANRFNDHYYLSRIINIINTKSVKKVLEPYTHDDLRHIARYINKDAKWRAAELLQAFNFLQSFKVKKNLERALNNISIGLQTPKNPTSYNACILYAICKHNGIYVDINTSIEDMKSRIELFYMLNNPDTNYNIRHELYQLLMYDSLSHKELVNIVHCLNKDKIYNLVISAEDVNSNQDSNLDSPYNSSNLNCTTYDSEDISYDSLVDVANEIRTDDIKFLPTNNTEAIVMAAIHYKIDITEVDEPIREYKEILRTPYFPKDTLLAKRLRLAHLHPDNLENPYLNKIFNPHLPPELYDMEDLKNMCKDEGYTIGNLYFDESPYTTLQMAYLLPTFLHGKQGNIINEETISLEEVADLRYDEIVIYGVRGSDMKAYTYGELSHCFHINKRFVDPQDDTHEFTDESIAKLLILSLKDQRYAETYQMLMERLELARIIESVKLYIETKQHLVKELLDRYDTLSPEDKQRVIHVFTLLMEAAMYMRNWSGEGDYPLHSSDTLVENQIEVDLRVTQSILIFEQEIENLNTLDQLGILIKDLPLMLHTYNNEFVASSSEDDGLTIGDRIFILKGGEDASIQSCIRLSSNKFCATAYYYLRLLGQNLPFSMEEVSYIS